MAKDFAKKGRRGGRGASRKKSKRVVSPLLLWMTLTLLAAFIGALLWLKQQSPKPAEKPKVAETTQNSKTIKELPLYKAHEEIVNKKVEIPAEELQLPRESQQFEYRMRCGSFRDQTRADELKARIALSGFESQIKPVTTQNGTWHRVELGPYASKRRAEAVRHRLQNNDIIDCVIDRMRKE